MIFECKSIEEFKRKLDAVEQLGLDYEIKKQTVFIRTYANIDGVPPMPHRTWTIETKEVKEP